MVVSNMNIKKKTKQFGGIILNPGCTNLCIFCGASNRKRGVLSPVPMKEQLMMAHKNLIGLRERGIKKVIISGGDPLEYDKIIDLINYIKENGFDFVQMATNGVKFADKSFLDKFVLSKIDKLRIPLYGSKPEIHDSITKTKGSFKSALNGIKGLKKKGPHIKIEINCLIMQQNKEDLLNIVDLVKQELGIEQLNFSIPCISNFDYSYYVPFKNLTKHVKEIRKYALKKNYNISFTEIPYCVFEEIDKSIHNDCLPPDLGKYCQPPENVKTKIKDLPSYRLKKKVGICKKCIASEFCGGFFVNDIDKFGTGKLKPLLGELKYNEGT